MPLKLVIFISSPYYLWQSWQSGCPTVDVSCRSVSGSGAQPSVLTASRAVSPRNTGRMVHPRSAETAKRVKPLCP